jgi:hypothetical protein
MRIRRRLAVILVVAVLVMPAVAKGQSEDPASTLLASAPVEIVSDLPFYFRLYRGRLPPTKRATYRGSSAMLYALKGTPEIEIEGAASQPLAEGAGVFIAAGQAAIIHAPGSEPADLCCSSCRRVPTSRRRSTDPESRRNCFERPMRCRISSPDPTNSPSRG